MPKISQDNFADLAKKYAFKQLAWDNDWNEEITELHFVLRFLDNPESLPMLEALLDKCSDSDLTDNTNALMWAMSPPKLSFAKLNLLVAKKPRFVTDNIASVDDEGQTVFHYFADNRYPDIKTMNLLIELGADINAVDDFGWTALHHFAYREERECSDALFQYHPIIVINENGHTPADVERAGSDSIPDTNFMEYECGQRAVHYLNLTRD